MIIIHLRGIIQLMVHLNQLIISFRLLISTVLKLSIWLDLLFIWMNFFFFFQIDWTESSHCRRDASSFSFVFFRLLMRLQWTPMPMRRPSTFAAVRRPPPPPTAWDVAGVQSTDAVASSDVGPSYSRSTPTGWWRRRPADRSSCCKNHQKCWRRRPTPRSTSPEMGRRRPPPPQSQWNAASTFDPDSHRPRFRDAFLNAATSPASFPRDEHPKLKRRPMKSTTSATTTTTPQWTLSINHRPAQRNPIETNDQRRWRRPEVVEKWPRVLLV